MRECFLRTLLAFPSVCRKTDQLLIPTDGMEKMSDFDKLDEKTETELQAAAFRRLRDHFQNRTDVQNIDLMTLVGFCRNCLSGWVQDAAREKGMDISKKRPVPIFTGCPILNGANVIKPRQQMPRKRPLIKRININKTRLTGSCIQILDIRK